MKPDDLVDLIHSVIVGEREREGEQYEVDDYTLAVAIARALEQRKDDADD
jgi:hypothetical protein